MDNWPSTSAAELQYVNSNFASKEQMDSGLIFLISSRKSNFIELASNPFPPLQASHVMLQADPNSTLA